MYFDSTVYIMFLTLIVLVYWRLRLRVRTFLLGASYFFYGWWDWRFLLLMAAPRSSITSSQGVLRIDRMRPAPLLLTLSLIINFGFLGFFKYFNFFVDSFAQLAALVGFKSVPHRSAASAAARDFFLHVPGGRLHRGRVPWKRARARSLVDYGLFISLFPHLIAGPIQRPSHLLPQVQTAAYLGRGQVLRRDDADPRGPVPQSA